jgi:predicted nucleic acid-binding protein
MTAVLDASVALKWQFEDEEATGPATTLLEDFIQGKIELISPTLFSYEIMSGIHVAINRKRIREADAYRALNYIVSLGIELRNFEDLIENTFRTARQYCLSPYDCAYIVLAEREKCDFITGDKRLFKSIKNHLPWVKWVGDY